jgi:GRASP55/65 PDZ-like domain
MFSALNSFISRLDSDSVPQKAGQNTSDTSYGFQVLKNTNADLPLEPWFDFIVGINGHYIETPDPTLFSTEIRNCAGSFCSLDLWNAKGSRTHAITIPVPHDQSVGLSLQLSPLNVTQNIWHILTVPSSLSPAYLAGLLPHSDYILGSPSGILRGESALGELVEDHLNRSLVLWVYNSEFDVVREVELIPRRGWGGEGALGAVLGYGALHRLPVGLSEEVQAPGEKMFDAERTSMDQANAYSGNAGPYFQPHTEDQQSNAPVLSPPPLLNPGVSPPPMVSPNMPPTAGLIPQRAKKGRRQGAKSPNRAFDDMFAEGEAKSAEQDFVPSRKGTPLAPPPKLATTSIPHSATDEKTYLMEGDQEGSIGEPGDAETT